MPKVRGHKTWKKKQQLSEPEVYEHVSIPRGCIHDL